MMSGFFPLFEVGKSDMARVPGFQISQSLFDSGEFPGLEAADVGDVGDGEVFQEEGEIVDELVGGGGMR